MSKKFVVSPAPHIKASHSVKSMMGDTIFALLPVGIGAVVFFGLYAGLIIVVSVAVAVLSEHLVCLMRKRPSSVFDLSCVVTGLLLAYTLPPRTPLWVVAIGAFVAIVFGKQVFGGIGFNPFNPALIGRAFLQVAFPQSLSNFSYDGVTSATPLSILKFGLDGKVPDLTTLVVGNYPSSLGETSVILLTLGYIYLVLKRHIHPMVPVVYIATVGAITMLVKPAHLWIYLFSGGLFLGAIFMATDPVTTPVSPKGKLVFAFGCGLLTSLIRFWGSFPEGVCFSILFMNMLTPLIDEFTVVKKFGLKRVT